MNRYDVIIVGAGGGGASAAYFLATNGARALVIEKASLPRYKPCGGAVPRATYEQFPFDFDTVIECETRGLIYSWQAGQSIMHDLAGRPIAMVMRDCFDSHILQHTPADIRDKTSIRSVEERGKFCPGGHGGRRDSRCRLFDCGEMARPPAWRQ